MRSIFENSTFKFGNSIMVECISSTCNYAPVPGYFGSIIQWVGQRELHMSMYSFDTYLTVFCSNDEGESVTSCLEYKELTLGEIFKT